MYIYIYYTVYANTCIIDFLIISRNNDSQTTWTNKGGHFLEMRLQNPRPESQGLVKQRAASMPKWMSPLQDTPW